MYWRGCSGGWMRVIHRPVLSRALIIIQLNGLKSLQVALLTLLKGLMLDIIIL